MAPQVVCAHPSRQASLGSPPLAQTPTVIGHPPQAGSRSFQGTIVKRVPVHSGRTCDLAITSDRRNLVMTNAFPLIQLRTSPAQVGSRNPTPTQACRGNTHRRQAVTDMNREDRRYLYTLRQGVTMLLDRATRLDLLPIGTIHMVAAAVQLPRLFPPTWDHQS